MTTTEKIAPIHPGEVLMDDFIEGFGITQNKLAVSIGVPPRRINEIVHGKRGITADTAIRLARYFGTSEEFWMNLQSNYELRAADGAPCSAGQGCRDHSAEGRMSGESTMAFRQLRAGDAAAVKGA